MLLALLSLFALPAAADEGDLPPARPPVQAWRVGAAAGTSIVGGLGLGRIGLAIGTAIKPESCGSYQYVGTFCFQSDAQITGTLVGYSIGNNVGAWSIYQIGDQTTKVWTTVAGSVGGTLAAIPFIIAGENAESDSAEGVLYTSALLLMMGGSTVGATLGRSYDKSSSTARLSAPAFTVARTEAGLQPRVSLSGRF